VARESNSTRTAFSSHPRKWRKFVYVYPVISRRSKGLSVGVNLNPDAGCNFRCAYCQVDRTSPRPDNRVDFDVLSAELRDLLSNRDKVFETKNLRNIPREMRAVRDIAFSGDGEPTISPAFPAAVGLAAELRSEFGLSDAKIVILTNACYLRRPSVIQTLAFLDDHNGEVWAKLDAGSQAYLESVNQPSHSLAHILDNILMTARVRPVVIQSLFMRIHGQPPPAHEIDAYVGRLRWLLDNGGQLKLVQAYTIARRPAHPYVSELSRTELEAIADAVRPLGVPVESYL
jgi:wyosine [tRNA(Phe)-imidazoG37] synthetase (radical SAM superfamily)